MENNKKRVGALGAILAALAGLGRLRMHEHVNEIHLSAPETHYSEPETSKLRQNPYRFMGEGGQIRALRRNLLGIVKLPSLRQSC